MFMKLISMMMIIVGFLMFVIGICLSQLPQKETAAATKEEVHDEADDSWWREIFDC